MNDFVYSETGLCEEYQRPYLHVLPSDPSFEDVKRVVVTEKRRPLMCSRWRQHEVTSYHYFPEARWYFLVIG